MTINATFQSFSASAMRLTFTERTAAATAPAPPAETVAPAASSGGADRVTLLGAADSGPAASADAPAPEGEPAPASPLFTRLDADQDGTMTKEEFTTGALALLGRRGDRSRVHGNGDGDNGRRARGVPGLERRFENAIVLLRLWLRRLEEVSDLGQSRQAPPARRLSLATAVSGFSS